MIRSLALYYGPPGRAARLRRFYRPFVGPGDLCFDIGAHVGDRTRCWSKLGACVIAVEPHPDLAALLTRLFRRDANVTVLPEAVAATPAEIELFVSTRTPTVSTLSRDWMETVARTPAFAGIAWDRTVKVRATTLDGLIARYGRPCFCKVDIEGFEAEALRGLSIPIEALSFEFVPSAGTLALGCIDRLMELGPYRFNVSVRESLRLAFADWLSAAAMRDWLRARPSDAPSGDIYARLGSA